MYLNYKLFNFLLLFTKAREKNIEMTAYMDTGEKAYKKLEQDNK